MNQKCAKNGFFLFIEKFGHSFLQNLFYNKNYSCAPAQIPYLGKFFFKRYWPKCTQPMRSQDFSTNHISRTNQ